MKGIILELIEERKKNDMDEWIERIKRNDEKQRQKLIKEAVMKIVKNMILNNEDDEKILKYADIYMIGLGNVLLNLIKF